MPSPHFFRYSYIVGGYGWSKGKRIIVRVHGVLFTFSVDKTRAELVKRRVGEIWLEETERLGNLQVLEEGEEDFEPVAHEEAVGIGFYRAHYFVNDVFVEKEDLRRR